MINNDNAPIRPLTNAAHATIAASMTDTELRNALRRIRRQYRTSLSAYNRSRALNRHAIFMTEFRSRNLARAATTD